MYIGGGIPVITIQDTITNGTIAGAVLALMLLPFSGVGILISKRLQKQIYGKSVWQSVKKSNRGQTHSIKAETTIQTESVEG
jgi:hypothetical protein